MRKVAGEGKRTRSHLPRPRDLDLRVGSGPFAAFQPLRGKLAKQPVGGGGALPGYFLKTLPELLSDSNMLVDGAGHRISPPVVLLRFHGTLRIGCEGRFVSHLPPCRTVSQWTAKRMIAEHFLGGLGGYSGRFTVVAVSSELAFRAGQGRRRHGPERDFGPSR